MNALLIIHNLLRRHYARCLPIISTRNLQSMQKATGIMLLSFFSFIISHTPAVARNIESDNELAAFLILFTLGAGLVIAIPIFIAFYRKHPNRWLIFVITIIFGATGLGWLIALVWSLSAAHLSPTGTKGGESGLNLFANDTQRVKLANELPDNPDDAVDKLKRLKTLYDTDALSKEEYEAMKKPLIKQLMD